MEDDKLTIELYANNVVIDKTTVTGIDYVSGGTTNMPALAPLNHNATYDEFLELVRPIMIWLVENHHPHTKVIIDSHYAELVEGIMSYHIHDYD
jgi:hypothetical protein